MKYILLLGDGMADYPVKELGGKTPLEVAKKPHIDEIARHGAGGYLRTIPSGMGAGSDVANLSIMGYDPSKNYTGRGPLEAASLGVNLKSDQMAFRCNLITEKKGKILDYSAGHISTRESKELIKHLNSYFKIGRFYSGVSYRNLFVGDNIQGIETTPPHDALGGKISKELIRPIRNPQVKELNDMMIESKKVLEAHPINIRRKESGENLANMIWLWGQGVPPSLLPFEKVHGVTGGIISAVDLLKGIGISAKMKIIKVSNTTGLIDTNWEGKAKKAIEALEEVDLVYLHVEAIDEASHAGDLNLKIRAIEEFDKRLVGTLIRKVDFKCRIAILPDHYTPLRLRTHTNDPVPYVISPAKQGNDGLTGYSEKEIREKGSLGIRDGHEFMKMFLARNT